VGGRSHAGADGGAPILALDMDDHVQRLGFGAASGALLLYGAHRHELSRVTALRRQAAGLKARHLIGGIAARQVAGRTLVDMPGRVSTQACRWRQRVSALGRGPLSVSGRGLLPTR
jgi:hypothetical protein